MVKVPKPPKPKLPKPKVSLGQHVKNETRKAVSSGLKKNFGVLGAAIAKKYIASPRSATVRANTNKGADKKIQKKKLNENAAPPDAITESAKQVTAAIEIVSSNATRNFAAATKQAEIMGEDVAKALNELSNILDKMLYQKKSTSGGSSSRPPTRSKPNTDDDEPPPPTIPTAIRAKPKSRARARARLARMKANRLPGVSKFRGLLGAASRIPGIGLLFNIGSQGYDAYGEYQKNGNVARAGAGFAGGLGGAIAGGAAGAALGSVVPGIGTLAGGLVGGTLGAMGGSAVGQTAGHSAYDMLASNSGKATIGGNDHIIHKMKYKADKIKFVAANVIEFKSRIEAPTAKTTQQPKKKSAGFFNDMADKLIGGRGGSGSLNNMGDAMTGGGGGGGGSDASGGGTGPAGSAGKSGGGGFSGSDTNVAKANKNKTGDYKEGTERLTHQGGRLEGINPKLMHTLKESTKDLPPGYHAEIISGHDSRATGTTNHPGGIATDIKIYDDQGRLVPHDRGGPGMAVYEKMHQSMVERGKALYPNEKFIWGGAWQSGAAGNGDPMHMQIVDPNVPGSSRTSGAYDSEKGVRKGHDFEPYMMKDEERNAYKQKVRDNIKAEAAGGARPGDSEGKGGADKTGDAAPVRVPITGGTVKGIPSESDIDAKDKAWMSGKANFGDIPPHYNDAVNKIGGDAPTSWNTGAWKGLRPVDNFDTQTGERRFEDRRDEPSPLHDDEYSRHTHETEAYARLSAGYGWNAPPMTKLGGDAGLPEVMLMEKQQWDKNLRQALEPPTKTPTDLPNPDSNDDNNKTEKKTSTHQDTNNSDLDHRPRQEAVQNQSYSDYMGTSNGMEDAY